MSIRASLASVMSAVTGNLVDIDFEERAAILEYDQGLPRQEAERLARADGISERNLEAK